jgi:putative peptide zinc metalloprotease protein
VRGAGFLLYFGIPGFYVDTTDIWMAPRPQRVTVSLAGVYANAVLAGIGMLVVALAPPSVASDLALLFVAILNVLICANLVPVLEKDGYYALSDCLEMPRLRRRAYEFLRRNLWARLKQRERLGRTEVIFLLYALLEAAMIALYVMITVGIVTTAGPSLLRTLRDNPSSTIETVLPALAILLFFPIARLAAPRLRRALNHRRGTEATAGRG